ncbi:MAG: hypothetical protein MI976_04930, partial [Pseudomonadales bacterium]|nr:hypothetical protein [Pseudomonadales bacterium]
MLINPTVQQPSYTAQPNPVPNGVGQDDVVRSDLPPVTESPESGASQNQQLQQDRRFQQSLNQQQPANDARPSEDQRPASQPEPAQQTQGERDSNSTQVRQQQDAQRQQAQEEQRVEQQRAEDDAIIRQLKARDREVRLHEAAHAAVGGRYAGSPKLDYERGPDGVNYAVSGEVSISVSAVAGDPEATLEKARQIRAAALAPAEPSSQDRQVAAEASRLESLARADIQQQKVEAEQQRQQRVEDARNADLEEENSQTADTESVDTADVEPVVVQTQDIEPRTQSAENSDQDSSEQDQGDNKTAKEELEEILLGNRSIP